MNALFKICFTLDRGKERAKRKRHKKREREKESIIGLKGIKRVIR